VITYCLDKPYEKVYLSNTFLLPHIYVLFYTQYPPEEYQRHPLRGIGQGNWSYDAFNLGRYHIDSLEDIEKMVCRNSLLIAWANEAREMARRTPYVRVRVISRPSGVLAIELFECR